MVAYEQPVGPSMGLSSFSNGEKTIQTSSSKAVQKQFGSQIRLVEFLEPIPQGTNYMLDGLQCLRKCGDAEHCQ